jgi:hypothetical protein
MEIMSEEFIKVSSDFNLYGEIKYTRSYSQIFLPTQYASKVHPFLEVAETVNRFCEQ